jgi:hypothetical protein
MKLSVLIREKTVRLMTTMILSPQTPVNVMEDRSILKIDSGEDTARYLQLISRDRASPMAGQ